MVDSTRDRGERSEGWREDVSCTNRRVTSTSLRDRRRKKSRRGGKRKQYLTLCIKEEGGGGRWRRKVEEGGGGGRWRRKVEEEGGEKREINNPHTVGLALVVRPRPAFRRSYSGTSPRSQAPPSFPSLIEWN